jgi:hypothetical protein
MKRLALLAVLLACGPGAHAVEATACSVDPRGGMVPLAALYGTYPPGRDASGTSWQPAASPMSGISGPAGPWMLMLHGFFYGVADHQGGERGGDAAFISSMVGLTARRTAGAGILALHGMLALDPLSGMRGYPLLFQTGESYHGRPLIDRQHPHDFFSELALSYSLPVTPVSSVFAYAGLPGEPALGPPVYLERFSGMNNPAAPLSHHWLDATHVSFGVVTLGYVLRALKIESSAFRGREPNDNRWDLEAPGRLDSYAVRISLNPSPRWALQASTGYLESPEALEPGTDMTRTTVSAMYNYMSGGTVSQTTAAWGLNDKEYHKPTNAFLLESALSIAERHVGFARVERVEKDELGVKAVGTVTGPAFPVNAVSLGYLYEFLTWRYLRFGAGGLASVSIPPRELKPIYGEAPLSYMFFVRARLR